MSAQVSAAPVAVGASSSAALDEAYRKRADKFLAELVWMARTLRHGRRLIPLE